MTNVRNEVKRVGWCGRTDIKSRGWGGAAGVMSNHVNPMATHRVQRLYLHHYMYNATQEQGI